MTSTCAWLLFVFLAVLAGPVRAQSPCTVDVPIDGLGISATVIPPEMPLLAIDVAIRNTTAGRVAVTPTAFALVDDRGYQQTPLSAAEAKELIRNPAQVGWATFWFGLLGYVVTQAKQDQMVRRVDESILKPMDVLPGATARGALYFKPLPRDVGVVTLLLEGLRADGGPLAAGKLTCVLPKVLAPATPPTPAEHERTNER